MPDSIGITLTAKTMEGVDALDPQVTVDISETTPSSRLVSRQIVHNFNGQVTLAAPTPDGFPAWQVNVSFSRYDAVSGFFFLPRGNPPQCGGSANIQQMITLKKDYEQGNVQLTLAHFVVAGQSIHLLDCDLDENRNIVLHSLDLVKHLFNGGTSPISMHEYIVEDSAQQSANGISTVDLGYQLV